MNETVLDRFLRYVKIDTQSQEDSSTYPSTSKQFDLLNLLVKELKELGLPHVEIDSYGYVMATLPGNLPTSDKAYGNVPAVGFVSHVDTSPSASGKDVKPQIITNYRGGDLTLPGDKSVVIKESENPELKNNIGKTIITSDGTTLLGADDKAGIAAILEAIHSLHEKGLRHRSLEVVFTISEEIGTVGAKRLDYSLVSAKQGICLDAKGPSSNIVTSAPSLVAIEVTITGRAAHAGSAPEKGINAIVVAAEAISNLSWGRLDEETTANVGVIQGGVARNVVPETVTVTAELRSRNEVKFRARLDQVVRSFNDAATRHGATVKVDLRD